MMQIPATLWGRQNGRLGPALAGDPHSETSPTGP